MGDLIYAYFKRMCIFLIKRFKTIFLCFLYLQIIVNQNISAKPPIYHVFFLLVKKTILLWHHVSVVVRQLPVSQFSKGPLEPLLKVNAFKHGMLL